MSTQRLRAVFPVPPGGLQTIKSKMLNWCSRFGIFIYLDSNDYPSPHGRYDLLVGCGSIGTVTAGDDGVAFGALNQFWEDKRDWLFGHFNYDLKNGIEKTLRSDKPANCGFSEMSFFCPSIVCGITTGSSEIFFETTAVSPQQVWQEIQDSAVIAPADIPTVYLRRRDSKERYLSVVNRLKDHIKDGDCYEINYCCEVFADHVSIQNPEQVFQRLNAVSSAPFAACYRQNHSWLLCASPERFLQKQDLMLVSQPIKGTAKRGMDQETDEAQIKGLQSSEKERAENVMIVDLVRNDLARSSETGSVKVDDLFGVQTFPQVHQLVSTVSGTLRDDVRFSEAIKAAFPMGSMTGAPKVKVMELIEQYESARRGLYSGSVGYITPDGDFDFNVVIRSLQYNASTSYLSYHTGGAITWDSDPEAEWEEMLLKGWALERVFGE